MNGIFTTQQKDLLALLTSMQPICNKRTTLDITEHILFHVTARELILKATDLEISLQANIAIVTDMTEPASFLISGRRIFELVKELDGTIQFTLSDSSLQLSSGSVELALNIRDAQDFPPFPERIENFLNVNASFFLRLLNKIAFIIPQNNTNSALNGMLLELNKTGIALVGTDGHSLARITSNKIMLDDEKKWLLPKRAVLELKKLLETHPERDIFIGTCNSQLVFSGENFNFFTKLIADAFPQYHSVLDKEGFVPARLSREPFVKTLKRTSCLLAGTFVSTQFSFAPQTLKVSINNKEVGKLEETLVLHDFSENTVDSRFYSPYILNGLSAFDEDQINFFIKNSVKPIIFEASTDDYVLTYLVMPVSMAQE
jgi:DNA polymerase-3 subunit beta